MPEQDLQKQIDEIKSQLERWRQDPPLADHSHNGNDASRVSIRDLDLHAYGHMYLVTQKIVTIAIASTWYEVTSGFLKGVTEGVLFGGSHYIEVSQNGAYFIAQTVSLDSGFQFENLSSSIMVNGTISTLAQGEMVTPQTNKPETSAGTVILNLTAKDQVSIAVNNLTLAHDAVVYYAQLSLFRLA